jgi:hypothetical protein
VADYREYGLSDGRPTISSMICDSLPIFQGFKKLIEENRYLPDLFLMGRSLGSISAFTIKNPSRDSLSRVAQQITFTDYGVF